MKSVNRWQVWFNIMMQRSPSTGGYDMLNEAYIKRVPLEQIHTFISKNLSIAASGTAAVSVVMDVLFAHFWPAWPLRALMDESAHVGTAVVMLGAVWTRPSRTIVICVLSGAVLIDIDHIPLLLQAGTVPYSAPRPYSHSLTTLSALFLLSAVCNGRTRQLFLGLSFGLATHLFRDMATGGVLLFWPLSFHNLRVPYWIYVGALAASVSAIVARRRHS